MEVDASATEEPVRSLPAGDRVLIEEGAQVADGSGQLGERGQGDGLAQFFESGGSNIIRREAITPPVLVGSFTSVRPAPAAPADAPADPARCTPATTPAEAPLPRRRADVDAAAMRAAGHTLYQAANGVWLTEHVPPGYVSGWPGPGRT